MYNSRYSKILTVILIIVIVIIVGLLIFGFIDTVRKYNITNDAASGIEAFKNQIQSNTVTNKVDLNNQISTNTITNTVTNSVIIVNPYQNLVVPDYSINIPDNNNSNDNSNDNNNNGNNNLSDKGSTNGTLYKGFEMVGYIEIPKTDVELPILKEATKTAMEASVCVLTGVGLNEKGVTVISGHNYRNGLFFSNNSRLAVGDKIYITDKSGETVTYSIYKKYQTTSEDASYATVDTKGKREIVLTTCTDDSQNRIIICAREQ